VPELPPVADTLTAAEPDTEVEVAVSDTVAPSAVLTTVEAGATMVAPVESMVREPELAASEAEVAARFRAPAPAPVTLAVTAVGLLISAPAAERRTLFWLPDRLEPATEEPREIVPLLEPEV